MLTSIVSRPFMNDINSIIDHMLFTNQLGGTKLISIVNLNDTKFYQVILSNTML